MVACLLPIAWLRADELRTEVGPLLQQTPPEGGLTFQVGESESTAGTVEIESPSPLVEPVAPAVEVPADTRLWTPGRVLERAWTIDYQFRSIGGSKTVYEFGTRDPPPAGWAPLSRLVFPVNGPWHGLKVGLRRPRWNAHFEWLTPMSGDIQGDLEDYDWVYRDGGYTHLGIMHQRWIEGQMIDLGLEVRMWEHCFDLPVDFWPTAGFRWQRFYIMAYDLVQLKEWDVWVPNPYTYDGDVLTLDQQYYLIYIGGQLRSVLKFAGILPIAVTLAADWANAQAYNVDHHLLREGDRYTTESTHGDSWHVALTAEAPITKRITVGCQVDYLQIRTHGRHHMWNDPLRIDATWDNGVRVWSNQTWVTAFVGLRI